MEANRWSGGYSSFKKATKLNKQTKETNFLLKNKIV